jgi:hypothetical protein
MKLYYKKTDGGAEYYCLNHIGDDETGDITTAVLRTDGDELEVMIKRLHDAEIKVVIS